jgi:hypothetical protein
MYLWIRIQLGSVVDPGSGAFLTTGSGIRDGNHFSESLKTVFFLGYKYLNSLMRIRILDLGYFCPRIRDPNIPDPHPQQSNWAREPLSDPGKAKNDPKNWMFSMKGWMLDP